jgi:AraC family L-rhamnose operon regulatory protein RhaS
MAWPLHRNLLVYVPDRWRYRVVDHADSPLSLFVLFFEQSIFGDHERLGFENRPLFLSRESFAKNAQDRMREILFEQGAHLPGSESILRGLGWQFIGEMKRARTRNVPASVSIDPTKTNEVRVQHFIAELEETFFQPISLEAVADRLMMSKRSLTGIFRRLTGTSVLQYVRKLRVEHAKALLSESDRSVITISFECGFDNLSNFYRSFKKDTNISPHQWRCQVRKNRVFEANGSDSTVIPMTN